MSQLSRAAWKALYGNTGTVFPDNTTAEISEGDMRTFGENASDSFFQKSDDSYTAPFPQVTAAGTDTYTATLSPAITAYAVGQKFQILFTNANTGAATLALNALAALAITKNGTTALAAGDIAAGSIKILAYDGTRLQIIGDGGVSGFVTQVLSADVDITGPAQAVRFGTGASHLDTFEVHTGTSLLLHAEDQMIVDIHDDINPLLVTSIVASPTAFIVAGYDDGGTTPNALVQVNGGIAGVGVSIETAAASGNSIAITSDTDVNITGDNINLIGNVVSPALTGTPTAPTAAVGTNTTQVATTAFVQAATSVNVGNLLYLYNNFI